MRPLFPRIITTKRKDRTYRYLTLVESYRENGKIKQRQVGNLGNIDLYSQEEIRRLIDKLREFLHDDPYGTTQDLTTYGDKHYGIPYVVNVFWDRLGLTEFINSLLKDRQVEVDVALCTKILVLNRLIAPKSKLGVARWVHRLYLEELEGRPLPDVHHFYRAMDYLEEMKDALERHLYLQLTDLLSLKLTLVFYDLTSSYFEGTHCPLSKHGYSREHRPDRPQINIGLLVTPEGIPIAHQVFEGNVADKTTVPDAIKVLSERFEVGECVFVGDRGMITQDNLRALKEAGFRYIVGFHKRGREVSDQLLEEYQDLSQYTPLGEEGSLLYKEIPAAKVPAEDAAENEEDYLVRYILCHNPAKVAEDQAFREQALQEAEAQLQHLKEWLEKEEPRRGRKPTAKSIMLKVADLLNRKGMARFFDIDYDGNKRLNWQRNQTAIDKESLRDGKFLLKTNSLLPADQVVTAYKNLMQAENAFREIKDFIRLRPIYHYNEHRVRAHVLICVLAYLFEQWLEVLYRRHVESEIQRTKSIMDNETREKKLKQLKSSYRSGRRILEELDEIKAVDQQFIDKRLYSITLPGEAQKKILGVLELPLPPKVLVKE